MRSYLCLGAITLCLVGCQASNPYQGERVPLPPAPAAAATHFDRSAYPAPTSTGAGSMLGVRQPRKTQRTAYWPNN